jgi:hypothetical protein
MSKFKESDPVRWITFNIRGEINKILSGKYYDFRYKDKDGVIQHEDVREDHLELIERPAPKPIPKAREAQRRKPPESKRGSIWV